MSKEPSSSSSSSPPLQLIAGLKSTRHETDENGFRYSASSPYFPPPRTPLNTIPDPSQCQTESQKSLSDSAHKLQPPRAGRSSGGGIEASDNLLLSKRIGNVNCNYGTPRVSSGRATAQVEASSEHTTPGKSSSKASNIGAVGASTVPRPLRFTGARGDSCFRVSTGISSAMPEPSLEVPRFELVEDPSFWMDHNVQVLIRIRPLSSSEKALQGFNRCLRQEGAQTVVWLGHPETRFMFDNIACETTSQGKLFRVAGLPIVENCMSGYNSCMFAYGQTGGGKTYTMMGDIQDMDGKVDENCGITPRIFEYLFARIRAEEEKRKDEKLKFSCKCSFLEIYNEQITDLLEPSSTNLQLREDLNKGVYVESLTEYNVTTVNDVVQLLLQGAVRRKMAATNMNSESSRSHSVFTCIIESQWEKDSTTHFRFGRLNLVDLAGSERQKSSGAEGDRLKEAANINKSLSTLSLVIMSLVDLAHGKHRHVPYRDSRLTFLLQDSLGGNSKTTIIANISPSICSANETLSTLKFAQRAKLIQNNAKVNEDASGDVVALQTQIQQLKGQLSFLMMHRNLSSLSNCLQCFEEPKLGASHKEYDTSAEETLVDIVQKKDVAILTGSGFGDETDYENLKNKYDQKVHELLGLQLSDSQKELINAKLLIEATQSELIRLTTELRSTQEENYRLRESLSNTAMIGKHPIPNCESHPLKIGNFEKVNKNMKKGNSGDLSSMNLQTRLDKTTKDLEEARSLNNQYQEDQEAQSSRQKQVDLICEQVELETAKTILHLQEEVVALKLEFHEKLHCMAEENKTLRNTITGKDDEVRTMCLDWERATLELTSFLLSGSKSLREASGQIESIACSFPQANVLVGECVERAAKACVEKDVTILLLQKSLEDAKKMVLQMEFKLSSLKGATMGLTELPQLKNENTQEAMQIHTSLSEKIDMIEMLETELKGKEDWITEVEKPAKEISKVDSLLNKFEEAAATMKEADLMLNALLKANEKEESLSAMWKQAGEKLILEKVGLIEEFEQLKFTIHMKEEENAVLLDQFHYTVEEVTSSMSFLEDSFVQMQKDVEEKFRAICSDSLSTGLDVLYSICSSRSSLEDICANIMEKSFALFVLNQCHAAELFYKRHTLNKDLELLQRRHQECHSIRNDGQEIFLSIDDAFNVNTAQSIEKGKQSAIVTELGNREDILMYENLSLQKELERKDFLLKGLLFDFRLLQESVSNTKDIKDEAENLMKSLSQVQLELENKSSQLDDILLQHENFKVHLADSEISLFKSSFDLQQAQGIIDSLTSQNAELRVVLKEMNLKKSEAEEQLDEQKEIVKGLEKELFCLNSSVESSFLSSVEDTKNDFRRIASERNRLLEEIGTLKDKLEIAYALADENEALAVAARQESEGSKLFAEQKEEEVKILERSIEELEFTINVLEKKVSEMVEEVKTHQLAREKIELEAQALRHRLSSVENFTETMDSVNSNGGQKHHVTRFLELDAAKNQIKVLQNERAEHAKELKQCKDYISELVLHAEAQASQYHQKYKTLEAMFREIKADASTTLTAPSTLGKIERNTTRTRGSNSPFRCLVGMVQQMNLEKDQELSMARLRIEDLESLVASRQKEVCMLNTRLAAAESMTHDVIRDLLGVKLDVTNYANLIDQLEVQKVLEAAQQQTEESLAKEREIQKLMRQVYDLKEQKESCILEIHNKDAIALTAQMTIQQLEERDQLLSVQNEMLKKDKTNLLKRVSELDDTLKRIFKMENAQQKIQPAARTKGQEFLREGDVDMTKRLAISEKRLCSVNNELARYMSGSSSLPGKMDLRVSEPKYVIASNTKQ